MAEELYDFSDKDKENDARKMKKIYNGLPFRKANTLVPLEGEKRQMKRMEFLKQDIDNYRLFMIYCYNDFTKLQSANQKLDDELRLFSLPIENVLESDDFYKKLIENSAMTFEDRIAALQEKTKKSYRATEIMYYDMMAKIEKTCKLVLDKVETKDPVELSAIMLNIFDKVHATEIELMSSMDDKNKENKEDKGDPCDANKYLGIDFSFLGLFEKLPEECKLKNESTKISIVGPIKVQSTDSILDAKVQSTEQIGGGDGKGKGKGKSKSNPSHRKIVGTQYIMPRPAVVCRKKTLKRCKRAYVSCKTVMGTKRKYCRRNTKKAIAKYYKDKKAKK
jgi:hypothetical protein